MKIVNIHTLLLGVRLLPVLFVCSQPSKEYSSYRRYPLCRPSDDIRYPKTTSEVVAIVKEAIRRGVKVKAFGQRHSQTDILCTEGIPVDMRGLQYFKINSDRTATFGAGVSLRKALDYALPKNVSIKTMAAYGNITLGGAIGTGAHGSSIKFPSSISAQVARLTIVNGRGEIVSITKAEDLKSFRIHLGLLGIVVDVTLYTVPIYKVKAHNYVKSDIVLTNGEAVEWAKRADQLMFYWFPPFNEVIVLNYTFVPETEKGEAWNHLVPTSSYETNAFMTQYKELAFNLSTSECANASALGYTMQQTLLMSRQPSLYRTVPGSEPFYTYNGTDFPNPAVGYPHEMLASVCSEDNPKGIACIWSHSEYSLEILDNELGFDLKYLPEVINTIKDIIKKTPAAFIMQGIQLRFSGKNNIYMSTSYGRDTVHLELLELKRSDPYNDASGSLAGFQTILQTLARRFAARSHWGKSGMVYHSRDMLDLKLDVAARKNFVAAMHKYDPKEVFLNNFGRRLKYRHTKMDIDPLTTRCALLDNCFCSRDADCAATQICTTISGYKDYKVCQTKNIGPGKEFDRSAYPVTFNVAEWFTNTVPSLISSLQCKCKI